MRVVENGRGLVQDKCRSRRRNKPVRQAKKESEIKIETLVSPRDLENFPYGGN